MDATTTISRDVVVDLIVPDDAPVPVTARFGYRVEDPYAVTLSFLIDSGEWVTWTFARSLLDEGLRAPSGGGDVSIWPGERDGRRCLYLHTSSPHGAATFVVPIAPTREFLLSTYGVVPMGAETDHLDLDGELAQLLAG